MLITDDWGIAALDDEQRRDIVEIMDDRHGNRSTLITNQFPIKDWHVTIGDGTIGDATLGRLIHNAHRIRVKGESMQKRWPGTKDR